jgi:hypothetical protein
MGSSQLVLRLPELRGLDHRRQFRFSEKRFLAVNVSFTLFNHPIGVH